MKNRSEQGSLTLTTQVFKANLPRLPEGHHLGTEHPEVMRKLFLVSGGPNVHFVLPAAPADLFPNVRQVTLAGWRAAGSIGNL